MSPPCEPEPVRHWRPSSTSSVQMVSVNRRSQALSGLSERYALVVVRAGAYEAWYRGSVQRLSAGQLALKEPGEVYRGGRVFEPFSLQVAAFEPGFFDRCAAALGLRGPVHFRPTALEASAPACARAFAMHAALERADAAPFEAETLVVEALSAVVEACAERGALGPPRRASRAVQRARALLDESFAEKITLDGLAADAGVDKFHLVRAFREEVGLPPYEYLTHLRVRRASVRLARGEPAAEVAHAVGLCDESQLHRHFRRIVGTTPGRFARSLAGAPRRSRQHRPRP